MNIIIKLSKNKVSPSACTYLSGPNIRLRLHLGCQNKFHDHIKNNHINLFSAEAASTTTWWSARRYYY